MDDRQEESTGYGGAGPSRAPWRVAAGWGLLLAMLVPPAGAGAAGAAEPARAVSPPELAAHVAGVVVTFVAGAPVAGATVSLPDLRLSTVSRADGSFAFPRALRTQAPYRRIRAEVAAPGWGTWTIRGVPLYPGDTLLLTAELRRQPWTDVVLTPAERRSGPGPTRAQRPDTGYTCTGWGYNTVPTPTIWVYLTRQRLSKRYNMLFYAAHVLPNEWPSSWDADSLGAGAIAVRTYGAYRAQPSHAYSGGSGCADVTDWTGDQVFDPSWTTAAATQAANATFGSILLRSRILFLTQYWAGQQGDPCHHVDGGQFAGRMDQWGTQTCAVQGKLWPTIVSTFYADTTWSYVRNLLLDGSLQAGGPALPRSWAVGDGSKMTFTVGDAYNGTTYLTMYGTVYQTRAFLGQPSDTYHEQAALRCAAGNKRSCSVTLRLIASTPNGQQYVSRWTVSVPDDGRWRLYDHTAGPFNVSHAQVQFSVITWQTIGLDAASVTGPYGGP